MQKKSYHPHCIELTGYDLQDVGIDQRHERIKLLFGSLELMVQKHTIPLIVQIRDLQSSQRDLTDAINDIIEQ